jgi:hypothetical protein
MNMKNIQPVCYNPFPSFFLPENFLESRIWGADNREHSVFLPFDNCKVSGYISFLSFHNRKVPGIISFSSCPNRKVSGYISFLAFHNRKVAEKILFLALYGCGMTGKLNVFSAIGNAVFIPIIELKFHITKIFKLLNNKLNY